MRKTINMLVCVLLVYSMIGVSMVAMAGKPPAPPPPTGTIYFGYEDLGFKGYSLWKMNAADGSGKARMGAERCLYAGGSGSRLGQLSWLTHGGHYWLLRFCQVDGEEPFPDGDERLELFAVRDDGVANIQLTSNTDLELGYPPYPDDVTWGHDDTFASWFALKWVDGVETDPGLYRVGITFDGDGIPALAGTPTLVFPTRLYDPDGYPPPRYSARSYPYDWSPDGSEIVISLFNDRPSCPGLNIIDIETLNERCLIAVFARYPMWSPDGTKIAYTDNAGNNLYIINQDGTGNKKILTVKDSPNSDYNVDSLEWSPGSDHLAYALHRFNPSTFTSNAYIYRIAIDGSQNTLLTRDLPTDPAKWPVGWR